MLLVLKYINAPIITVFTSVRFYMLHTIPISPAPAHSHADLWRRVMHAVRGAHCAHIAFGQCAHHAAIIRIYLALLLLLAFGSDGCAMCQCIRRVFPYNVMKFTHSPRRRHKYVTAETHKSSLRHHPICLHMRPIITLSPPAHRIGEAHRRISKLIMTLRIACVLCARTW